MFTEIIVYGMVYVEWHGVHTCDISRHVVKLPIWHLPLRPYDKAAKTPMINFSYVIFSPTYFLHLTYKLVCINAQRWPKVTTDMCKRNRPFTVYGAIEKTLLDNWCVFVTFNWINRSFKWIMDADTCRQQHMNWTAFWWQSQRAHDRRSRPNLCRSGRKLSITRPIVRQNFDSRIQLWNGKCCSFLNKNLILAFILCAKIYKEPQIINHNSFTHCFLSFSPGAAIY